MRSFLMALAALALTAAWCWVCCDAFRPKECVIHVTPEAQPMDRPNRNMDELRVPKDECLTV